MADVRSLLRQEQARRNTTASRPAESTSTAATSSNKKRKISTGPNDHASAVESRKKARAEIELDSSLASDPLSREQEQQVKDLEKTVSTTAVPTALGTNATSTTIPLAPVPEIDEDEWAAFERDVASPPPGESLGGTAAYSGAVIEAAPLTAAQLAAQAREEQSAQRGAREVELEEEREDAARQMEEEMEEMEGLEARMRRLKEQREALRQSKGGSDMKSEKVDAREKEDVEEGEDDESEDVDEWEVWGNR